MFLRNMNLPPVDVQKENSFEYVDEATGEVTASAMIYVSECPNLLPNRPLQLCVEFDGAPIPANVMGAVLARARYLTELRGQTARLYTGCAMREFSLMQELRAYGFEDNDALLKLRLDRNSGTRYFLPAGYTPVRDILSDPTEQQLFVDRFNQLYGSHHDDEWVAQYCERDGFERLLALDASGIAGELTFWQDGSVGVIGYVQTTRQARRRGIASALITMACDILFDREASCVDISVRARIPGILKVLTRLGFYEAGIVTRYPGIDFDLTD